MSDARIEAVETKEPVARSRIGFGLFGFILALFGLAVFWLPLVGVLFWALGVGVSCVALFFRGARGFGVGGLVASAISFAFTYLFLVAPNLEAEKAAGAGTASVAEVVKKTVTGGGSDLGSANAALKEIFSSFGYNKDKIAATGTPSEEEPEPAADDSAAESGEDFFEEEDDEELQSETPDSDRAETSPTESSAAHARFPVARFAEISKQRSTWPRSVRLMRARTISLWDSEHKVIMGKMEIPAKSVVAVLDVKPDGSLLVRDRTEQLFTVLAADTDFAAAYAEKNDE